MRAGTRSIIAAIAIASATFVSSAGAGEGFWSASARDAKAIVDAMSPEERIAQLMMMSYPGDAPTPGILDWIGTRGLGGIKIFGWNADDTDKLAAAVKAMQGAALGSRLAVPLFVATDQEGGWIRHVKGRTSITPGNMAIGASGRPWDSYWSGFYIGRELGALGINMNFAPTVDLATNPDSMIIGPRAFSSDPVVAGTLAVAFFKGMRDSGVVSTAKHFPGHGATSLDSHGTLPKINIGYDTLWNRELVPYRMLIAEGLPAIMSGHLGFPALPMGNLPASLSPYFLQDVLRKKMGYEGIVITDDVNMSGATGAYGSLAETCYRAILAGNDMIEMSGSIAFDDSTWKRLANAYRDDAPFRARVDESATRIVALKLEYFSKRGPEACMPSPELSARLPDPEGKVFFFDMAFRSATVVEGRGIPLVRGTTGRTLLAGQFPSFFSAGRKAYPDAEEYRFPYTASFSGDAEREAAFRSKAAAYDTIVVCCADGVSKNMVASLRNSGKRVYVVSVLNPVLLRGMSWVQGSVAVYSFASGSIEAAFAVLSGAVEAEGHLPFPKDALR